jgi:hypothetical protein
MIYVIEEQIAKDKVKISSWLVGRRPSAEDLIYMANAGPLGSGPKYSVWIPNDATHRELAI